MYNSSFVKRRRKGGKGLKEKKFWYDTLETTKSVVCGRVNKRKTSPKFYFKKTVKYLDYKLLFKTKKVSPIFFIRFDFLTEIFHH